ncbi:MAG: DUF3810 domain-containing protein [Oscillospiraceae bacterium]|nr:DUF3810 domain-containing protein [Oscillospiraceae bacterium]
MRRKNRMLAAALLVPVFLMLLFAQLRDNRAIMDGWVYGIMGPVEQMLGRLWSIVPFSVAEVLCVLAVAGALAWLIYGLVRLVRDRRWRAFLRRVLCLAAAVLWLLAGLDWLWNAGYYASTFAQRSGLECRPCSVEELERVTVDFAELASELACQVERDEQGHFALSPQACIRRGVNVYEGITEEFPLPDVPAVRTKPLVCSRLQSILGFTGIYFPFTGEANVNVDAPTCLLPATIAHEMAHQHMVAAEEEANFVGIAACVTGEDVTFAYSGYLMGLIHLSNALYRADPQRWYAIREGFSPELATDWTDNNEYWAALKSPVEEAAGQAYDAFLKGNDQPLGLRSYGACVDLLVAWWTDRA